MGKIETRKRDCRRSVGIKYKIKPLKKMAHSRDKRTGMNRQQNLCLIPVRLYPFFRNGFILRWWRKICVVKGGEAMQVAIPKIHCPAFAIKVATQFFSFPAVTRLP